MSAQTFLWDTRFEASTIVAAEQPNATADPLAFSAIEQRHRLPAATRCLLAQRLRAGGVAHQIGGLGEGIETVGHGGERGDVGGTCPVVHPDVPTTDLRHRRHERSVRLLGRRATADLLARRPMSTYLVVNSTIDDPALLDEYVNAAGATLGIVPLKVLAIDTESKTVEGEPAGPRTVILEFESEDDFHTWYGSPEYQAIIGKRRAATTGFAVLAKGF